jgi:hypothetical protein
VAAEKMCAVCGVGFCGRADARFCSARCRQRARRSRVGGKCDGVGAVTVLPGVADGVVAGCGGSPAGGGHCVEALVVLAALDAELAENSVELGETLAWSAAENTVRELIADTIDRRTELLGLYQDAAGALKVRLSAELRLLEQSVARLLKQVKTDLPKPVSRKSQKAAQAARVRWDRA